MKDAATIEAELAAARRAAAERAVREAVRRGAIPSQDRELREAWLAACIKDSGMIDLLARHQGNESLRLRLGARAASPHFNETTAFADGAPAPAGLPACSCPT